MTFVPQSSFLPRFLWRPAMFFFAVAQIALAFAPLADVSLSGDARAHVEEAGIELHHAHSDADCAACTARELLSSSQPVTRTVPDYLAISGIAPVSPGAAANGHEELPVRSRAPPVLTRA